MRSAVMSDENAEEENAGEEKAGRPNSKYKLSGKIQENDSLMFYYSREQRLSKAPQAVRDLYNSPKPQKTGILHSLTANRGRTFIFASIVLMCAALLLINILDPSASYRLNGNQITAQAMKYEGAIIVLVKKSLPKSRYGKQRGNAAYTGEVSIHAFPLTGTESGAQAQEIFMHRILFTRDGAQEFRFTLPFEADTVMLVFQAEKKQLSIKLNVE